MIAQKKLLRVARFAVLLAAVLLVAFWIRGKHTYTLPPTDQSLDPAYPGGSRVLVQDLAPDAPLERGTDVVYVMEKDGVEYARFGRVRGLPGDAIGAQDGKLTVNGEPIGPLPLPGELLGRVPEGHVCILAVNPLEHRYPDSRTLGFVPREKVRARILFRLPG